MDVITSPVPEAAGEPSVLTALPTRDERMPLPHWIWPLLGGVLVVGLLIGAMANPWRAPVEPAEPSLADTLQWMFTATLTYEATTSEGEAIPPPAERAEVREVEILDPVSGPVLVITELSDGSRSELVPFEIETSRQGRAWSVSAVPITDQEPPPTRPGS